MSLSLAGKRPRLFFVPAGRFRRFLGLAVAAALAACLWFSALPGLAYYYAVTRFGAPSHTPSLSLGCYRADIEARPVTGLPDNLSGLTFSPETGTLFAVINRPPTIAELSTDGRLLRSMALSGIRDPEGVTHVGGDRFIVSDEHDQSLHWLSLGPGAAKEANGGDHLRLDFGTMHNMGFEGLSWDSARDRLYVTQEMFPSRVIIMEGLAPTVAGAGIRLGIDEWKPRGLAGAFMLDLSSATLHETTGNLLLLSHMSAMLVEHAPDGGVLSFLPLWKGMQGLRRSVAQAEGVAIGSTGDIFIVSEPNLFYRFTRSDAACSR